MSQSDITAAMPGIFYTKPSPEEPSFVQVGDTVAVGDTVGLIEVMKMFQNVTADVAGVVEEFLVDDEDAVAMGQALVRIATA